MNERIEELYKQSFIEVQDENSFPCMNFSKQKFAELIIKECADFVREYPEKYLTHNQAREIGFGMEEHFGVEE